MSTVRPLLANLQMYDSVLTQGKSSSVSLLKEMPVKSRSSCGRENPHRRCDGLFPITFLRTLRVQAVRRCWCMVHHTLISLEQTSSLKNRSTDHPLEEGITEHR
jgi:hypothetical protein